MTYERQLRRRRRRQRAQWSIPTRLGQRRARSAALLNALPCRRRSGLAKNDDEPRPARAPIDLIGTRTSSPPPRELAGGTPRPPPLNSFKQRPARPGTLAGRSSDADDSAEDSGEDSARRRARDAREPVRGRSLFGWPNGALEAPPC